MYLEFTFIIDKIYSMPNDRLLFGNYAIYSIDIIWFYSILATLLSIFTVFILFRDIINIRFLNKNHEKKSIKISRLFFIWYVSINLFYIFSGIWHMIDPVSTPFFLGEYFFWYFIILFITFFIDYYLFIYINGQINLFRKNLEQKQDIKLFHTFNTVVIVIYLCESLLLLL